MQRATLYIDGFNFYYGVTKFWQEKNEEWAGLGWCDFRALVERHFPPRVAQLDVKYFTARPFIWHMRRRVTRKMNINDTRFGHGQSEPSLESR
jgi:hypothetical protein